MIDVKPGQLWRMNSEYIRNHRFRHREIFLIVKEVDCPSWAGPIEGPFWRVLESDSIVITQTETYIRMYCHLLCEVPDDR